MNIDSVMFYYMIGGIFLLGLFIGTILGYSSATREYESQKQHEEQRPAIDLALLSSIPNLKIQGSGIDIDTSKMVNKKSEVER